ncbi:MAG: hypothetical protein EOO85_30040 [Pedobacter sp.]|nr:MAG: hypothetical protein EOO85_30040 [Pedobacter sp.]
MIFFALNTRKEEIRHFIIFADMNEEEFEIARVELLTILADAIGGKNCPNNKMILDNRIVQLNKLIDSMPPIKQLHHYVTIDMCQQYYRIRYTYFNDKV